jgi:hypothetical protein
LLDALFVTHSDSFSLRGTRSTAVFASGLVAANGDVFFSK